MPDGHPRGWDYDSVPDGWVEVEDFLTPVAAFVDSTANWQGNFPTYRQVLTTAAGDEGQNDEAGSCSAGASAGAGNGGGVLEPTSGEVKLAAVREFLIEVGLSAEMVRDASRAELWGYLRGRVNI